MSSSTESQNRFKSMVFRALSDPIRLEILAYLRDGEKCVCDIVPQLNLIQPLVSRHLKVLKDVGIVRCRKDGTKRMYSIVDNRLFEVIDSLNRDLVTALTNEALKQMTCR
jgi:DNA-binding transcriptional ArsR family regulator